MAQAKKVMQSRVRSRPDGLAPNTDVDTVIELLKRAGTKKTREGYVRFGLDVPHAFGVSMVDIQTLAKSLGPRHDLRAKLWATEWYEARLLVAFVADPVKLKSAEMERWCRDFADWGTCDTLCFKLFDRSPLAYSKIEPWAQKKGEFQKRAAFALLASLALHDKGAADEVFLSRFPLIEAAAADGRNFVKKAVSWALRAIGKRNQALRKAAIKLAEKLAASSDAKERWVGKDALRDLSRVHVRTNRPKV